MTREQLAKEIYSISHITGEFKLRSGAISNEYFDKYLFESKPQLLIEIALHLLDILPQEYDVIAGLELGGIPIAVVLAQFTGNPVSFVRKKAKEYGTCKFAEGADIKGKKLLVIEDVITSGGQVVLSANDLRKSGAVITDCLCVIDRESGAGKALAEIGITLKPLFTMSELKSINF